MWRGVSRAQKIRMRLGGSARLAEPFPDEPKGMHWRTYSRLRDRAQASENLSNISLMQWANRLKNSLKLPFLIGSWRRAQPSAGPHTVQRRLANATTRIWLGGFEGSDADLARAFAEMAGEILDEKADEHGGNGDFPDSSAQSCRRARLRRIF